MFWQSRTKSLSEFFNVARNTSSMYFTGEPTVKEVEVRDVHVHL